MHHPGYSPESPGCFFKASRGNFSTFRKSFAKFPLTVTVFFEKSDNILNFARFAVLKTGFFIYPEYKNKIYKI